MTRVVIESPFGKRVDGTACTAAEMAHNVEYARACMRHAFSQGEAPYASHLLYPQIFDDAKPEERKAGMHAGFAWGEQADTCAVYCDHGLTPGMKEGIARAEANNIRIEFRYLDPLSPGLP